MTEGESSSRAGIVNIDELVNSMRRDLNYYWLLGETYEKGTKCLIYKVQQHIRMVDRKAYEPIVLSIGPYHYGNPALQAMEKDKWNCLYYVLKLNPEKKLQDYLEAIGELENQARACYSEEIKMEYKEFLQMLLLDGCFILVSLYGLDGIARPKDKVHGETANHQEIIEKNGASEENITEEHATKKKLVPEVELSQVDSSQQNTLSNIAEHDAKYQEEPDQFGLWYVSFITHDLLLLENQIPFFVVQRIYELVAGEAARTKSLTNRIAKFVEEHLYYYPKAIRESGRPKDFQHLLHLAYIYVKPSQRQGECHQYWANSQYVKRILHLGRRYLKLRHQPENEENSYINQHSYYLLARQQRWRRAVQYHEAGVEFKKREFDEHSPHSLLDIKYSNGVMEIPRLPIDPNTLSFFRNFIAFEQTCPQVGNDIAAYTVFMSQLISMADDVTLLARRGIIMHQLRSDEEVSALFTKLTKDVVFDFNSNHYLKSLSWIMEAHYQSRLNRWMAWLRHNHFSNPWLSLAALAASIVLFCTVVQTLVAVFSYTAPPSPN
uniref:Uncharacterized protein n=1 Tax=Ananas comosus var. bracteatus TaxID=296719 RepID=A0A6V7PW77_ANACO|nr:unnamed protein product [Ananas comosus var. bracteatus]